MTSMRQKSRAFTIVELIVVIAVIGVIATVVLVGYSTVRTNAITSDIKSDLSNAYDQLSVFQIQNGNYPTTLDCSVANTSTNFCLKTSNNVSLSYQYNNINSPKTYCLTAAYGTIYYYTNGSTSSVDQPLITSGACSIVTSGLVFFVDAANTLSYSGSGATWFDLSGNGYNVSLVGSPTYSSGTIQFRGLSGQYGSTTFDQGVLSSANSTGTWTIETAFKAATDSIIGEGVIAGRAGCHGGIYTQTGPSTFAHAIKTNSCWTGAVINTVSAFTTGNYYHTTMTYNNGVVKSYVNGNLISTSSINLGLYTIFGYSTNFYIGGIPGAYPNYYTNTDIGYVAVYNKELSSSDVLQNFTAVRSRYGL